MTDDDLTDDATWHRLPRRLLLIRAIPSLLTLAGIGLAFALLGEVPAGNVLLGIAGAVVFGLVRDLGRVYSTRVRVGSERIELRSGVFTTTHRSLRRDRVRTVDLTGPLLHRLVGLAVLRIGTGEQARGEDTGDLELDGIDSEVARTLQQRLLPGSVGADADLVSSLQLRWLPWSIPSWWTLALPAILVGAILQVLGAVGIDPSIDEQAARDIAVDATAVGLALLVAIVAASFLLVGVLARCASFLETWWAFELRRDRPAGLLRSTRGLLTTRSTSLQLTRIRGAQLREPILLRPFRVATATVVTTGLADRASSAERGGSTSLGPAAPRREVEAIAADVLDQAAAPTALKLRPHPPAARRRRVLRAAFVVVGVGIAAGDAAWVIEFDPTWALAIVLATTIVAIAIAIDLARALGHAVHGRWLVVRSGSLVRTTTALELDGVVGWIGRRTFFQRRARLVTIVAATAAGSGSYAAIDVDEADGVALVAEAAPTLLAPFVER